MNALQARLQTLTLTVLAQPFVRSLLAQPLTRALQALPLTAQIVLGVFLALPWILLLCLPDTAEPVPKPAPRAPAAAPHVPLSAERRARLIAEAEHVKAAYAHAEALRTAVAEHRERLLAVPAPAAAERYRIHHTVPNAQKRGSLPLAADDRVWIGYVDENGVLHCRNQTYSSPTAFASAHLKAVRPDRSCRANGPREVLVLKDGLVLRWNQVF